MQELGRSRPHPSLTRIALTYFSFPGKGTKLLTDSFVFPANEVFSRNVVESMKSCGLVEGAGPGMERYSSQSRPFILPIDFAWCDPGKSDLPNVTARQSGRHTKHASQTLGP